MLHNSEMVVPQVENFKPEVKRLFGDMRRKVTWEKAFAHFYVQWLMACVGDGDLFFKLMDPERWPDWQKELKFLILEALLAHKDSREMLPNSYRYLRKTNREDLANGFLALARQSRGGAQAAPLLASAGTR
ncbi:hypothetical protein H6G13_27165 [Pseudanabaena sp. FACHB-2040]|nr:hypothetical protein [Pseudanabaena sp. FACHB-2040]